MSHPHVRCSMVMSLDSFGIRYFPHDHNSKVSFHCRIGQSSHIRSLSDTVLSLALVNKEKNIDNNPLKILTSM